MLYLISSSFLLKTCSYSGESLDKWLPFSSCEMHSQAFAANMTISDSLVSDKILLSVDLNPDRSSNQANTLR